MQPPMHATRSPGPEMGLGINSYARRIAASFRPRRLFSVFV